ncbi:MAG: LON peptidase substrate-binding domain-containing protein, partial [Gemmatimonadota bacterium]|nr:LON peptidase substrate-binding domain-containing protein [Gemmatimonadota bacterium]
PHPPHYLRFVPPRILPLFPLPLVLFPGATMALHIFEPRYRKLLSDCRASETGFGIVCLPEGMSEPEIPAGWVGCEARIDEAITLEDGRSNIVVKGGARFAITELVQSQKPYRVAKVTGYDDAGAIDESAAELAAELRESFARVAQAARTLADDRAPMPELPTDPALVAFVIASMIDLDLQARQELLMERSAMQRLRTVQRLLSLALEPIEERAAVHEKAKSNGKGVH